ncbi:MAG: AI-2E family transporter [Paludibacteraceae bacterium]|nr:AI-2E family transporter [Paludibacteraceae bacterium]MCR5569929.1 AI-2E family transporter [Paludibacteraceae bacterium]
MSRHFSRQYTFNSVVHLVIRVLVCVCLFLLLKYLKSVLLPFFVAWLFAYLFQPIVDFLQRYLKSRTVSILLVMVSILTAVACFICFMVPTFITEFVKLKELLVHNGEFNSSIIPAEWADYLSKLTDNNEISQKLTLSGIFEMVTNMFPHAWSLLSASANALLWVFGFIFVLIYLFFILRDQDAIALEFIKLLPHHYKGVCISLLRDLRQGMNLYFRRQALIACIDAFMFAVGFYIIDMPMGIVMGVTLGALNMVPYLQYLGLPPAAVLMLIQASETGGSVNTALLSLLGVFVVVQIVQDLYLIPKFMGKTMGMNPAVVLLSLSIWGYVLGVIGMIIALPATTILMSYYKHYFLKESMRSPFSDSPQRLEDVLNENEVEDSGNEEH